MKQPLFICLLLLISAATSIAQSKLRVKGAQLTQAGTGYAFTEGPAVAPNGDVYFTDQPNDRILKWSPGQAITVFMEKAGRSNGMYFDNEGRLLSCADEKNEIWRIGLDKSHTVLVTGFEGKLFNGPNDLWVDPQGGVYFTDPFYKRPWWDHSEKEIPEERVYFYNPKDGTISMVADGFVRPNGIVGTPDGKKLYVADINASKTYVFDIAGPGKLTNKKLFAEMGSDGMTLDKKGNVYLTGKGVTVFDKNGQKIDHIEVPENWTANVCFGGKKQKTLFITASKSAYILPMRVRGVR